MKLEIDIILMQLTTQNIICFGKNILIKIIVLTKKIFKHNEYTQPLSPIAEYIIIENLKLKKTKNGS